VVYRLTSLVQVDDQLLIEAEGGGVSRLLGGITATASVTQATLPDPCDSYSADFDFSAAQGSLSIHSAGQVCSPPTRITGTWSVTGGTGAFAGATGSGTETGKSSFTGNDPVIDQLSGILIYPDPGTTITPLSYESCTALNDRYVQAWQEAKACNPHAERVPQCTEPRISDLICGCTGYVNTRKKRALQTMDAASRAFTNGACGGHFDCTAGLCPWTFPTGCQGDGHQGTCVDGAGW